MSKPSLLIVAGPNGSGKTTVSEFLSRAGHLGLYLNADLIAKGLETKSNHGGRIESGRVMLSRLHEAIKNKEDISFESTLSGKTWLKLIQSARAAEFEITICYVSVKNSNIAVTRVAQRVKEGGHDVSIDDVRRRFDRSLRLFLSTYKKLVDNWYLFDNSFDSATLVAFKEKNNPVIILDKDLHHYYLSTYGQEPN